jgi:superkiller protein 3
MTQTLAGEELQFTTEEEYRALLRSLRRRRGFGIIFVQCTPVGGQELIKKVEADLPLKNIDVLKLDTPITNLIERIEALPNQTKLNILFIVGLEKSLVEYIRPGYGGVGDYYKLDTVPPILNHLNWQRENFRDRFRHLCFVFLLPPFALKYVLFRAPDFADWRSGMIDIPTDRQLIEQETTRLWMDSSFEKYRQWTPQQRLERIAEIQTYLNENPDLEKTADLWFEQGNILLVNEEYEEAVNSYDEAIKARPNQSIKFNPISQFFQKLFRRKVPIIKGFYLAWNNRGNALGNLGRDEEEIASYDQCLKIKPDYTDAWYNRGVALGNLGRDEEEIASYDQCLKIKPDYTDAWLGRGNALGNLGRYEEAIASYDQCLKIKPDYADAWNNRGVALGNLGRNEEAIASYDQCLKIKPDYAEAWLGRGNALGNLGRDEEAIASYDQCLKIKPDYAEAWLGRGNALGNLGRNEEAIASYDQCLKIKPDYTEAWLGRGNALGNLGRDEEAIASYDQAIKIKIKPDSEGVTTSLKLRYINRLNPL